MHRIVSVKQVGWRIGVLRKKRLVLAEGRLRVRLCVLGLLAKHPSVGGEGRGSRSTSPLPPPSPCPHASGDTRSDVEKLRLDVTPTDDR